MKKIYTLALGLLLGGLGLTANAAATELPNTIFPDNGEYLTSEEMEEYFGSPYWAPYTLWDGAISYNTESEAYKGNSLKFDVYIDEELFSTQVEAEIFDYNELDIYLNPIWDQILASVNDDFYLEIKIPAGCLFVGDEGDQNAALTIAYIIYLDNGGGGSTPTIEYLPDPSFDLVDNELLFVCWNTQIYPMDDEEGNTVQGLLSAPNQNPEPVTLFITSWGNGEEGQTATYNDNALMLDLAPYIEKYGNGKYSLRIWEETVNDGESAVNSEVTWSATIEKPVIPDETIDYVYFSINTKEITLLYDYDVTINPYCDANIVVYDPMGGEGSANPTSYDITIVGGQVTINLAPYNLEDGVTYHYEIPAGYFIIGDEYINDSIEGEFNKTSGINGIGSEFGNAPVYNLQGVKVGNSTDSLSNGIYIVNGKKVMVRK